MKAVHVLLALLVNAALALGVAEVGLRAMGFSPSSVNTEFDPELGWRKTPRTTIQRSTGEFDVTLTTDGAGLRDDYEALAPAPEGTQRAVFLGDSFVVGYTVDRDDLFVDQLERALQAEGRPIEIMNAGTQGYSTDQSLRWLELYGERVAPDLVVHFAYENDIWWNASPTYLGNDKPLYGEDGALVERTLEAPPDRHWSRALALGEAWYRLLVAPEKPTVPVGGMALDAELSSRLVDPPAETLAAEARTRALIAAMAARCEALGARLVVCPIPSRAHVQAALAATEVPEGAPLDPARPSQVLVEAARAAGATVVDPLLAIATFAADAPVHYRRDFHLNGHGNVALAVALHGALDGAGLLPAMADGAGAVLPAGPPTGEPALPPWLLWYLGLAAALGLLYTRTYPDEGALKGACSVAALLAVVFGTALGVSWVVELLPPRAATLTVLALVLGLLTFVLYKLGERLGTIAELVRAFTLRGHWYLLPLLSVLLTVGSLLVVAASSPLVAPFIYTLF